MTLFVVKQKHLVEEFFSHFGFSTLQETAKHSVKSSCCGYDMAVSFLFTTT